MLVAARNRSEELIKSASHPDEEVDEEEAPPWDCCCFLCARDPHKRVCQRRPHQTWRCQRRKSLLAWMPCRRLEQDHKRSETKKKKIDRCMFPLPFAPRAM